jgi:uncharacterized protein YxjI
MPTFQYPLQLRFKLIALAPRIIVTDASGQEVLFVHQDTFKLKEDIHIYRNQSKNEEVYRIKAESIIDFSARYNFTEAHSGKHIGHVKSKGWRSIWKTTYLVHDAADIETHVVEEDNPWVKVLDALFMEIPFVGMLSGYFLHPSYTVQSRVDGQGIMQITKQPAFFEGLYTINLLDNQASYEEEIRSLLSLLLLIQFMRRRG